LLSSRLASCLPAGRKRVEGSGEEQKKIPRLDLWSRSDDRRRTIMNNPLKKRYGLLGKNISYSLSPAMHNAAFKHFQINAAYELFDENFEDKKCNIDESISSFISEKDLNGINVTVPYKIDVHDMLKEREDCTLDEVSELLGAVNTVKISSNKLKGFNTDASGFFESLKEEAGFDPAGKNIFLFGAGGAGRAICIYLACLKEGGPNKIYVYDEKDISLLTLVEVCKSKTPGICERVEEKDISTKAAECDLLINATPVGSAAGDNRSAVPLDSLQKGMVVYDLVYARETALIKAAKENDIIAVNGLGMLVNQAALAFEIWTGTPFNEVKTIMKQTALNELARRKQ